MTEENINYLLEYTSKLNIDLKLEEEVKFKKYKELLKDWNKKINLTAITDDKGIDIKHFLDSIMPLTLDIIKDNDKIIDIGTGGGFPGIPLKIMNETLSITLLDSLNKRINFLNNVIKELNLEKINAVHGRAEELSRRNNYREKYNIAISRAVAPLNTLCEYCIPFVKKNGYFISMKGPNVDKEIKDSYNAINTLGGKLIDVIDVSLPDGNREHSLVIIKKVKNTPKKYPRGGGKPRKSPL